MIGGFQLTIKPVFFDGLLREFPQKVKKAGYEGIDQIAEKSKRQIASLTPGDDLPKGWDIKKSGNKFGRTRLLYNRDPRAYKKIITSRGEETNLLMMLEYGTREHEIRPKKAKALVFQVDGETIFTKQVDHPGTQPYGFAVKTYTSALYEVGRLQNRLAQMLRQGV